MQLSYYIITTKYFWVPEKKKKTNKCVWLLSIYCGFCFCPFNLLMCWIFIFFHCSLITLVHTQKLTDDQQLNRTSTWSVSLLLWFVLPGFSGWPVGGGLSSLPPAALLGLDSLREIRACCLCCLSLSPHAFGEYTWGELKEGQGVLGALPQPGKVPGATSNIATLPAPSRPACHGATHWGRWGEPYAKGQLIPIWTVSYLLFTAGDLLDLWSCNTARTAKGKNEGNEYNCLIPRWWCVWLTFLVNAEWNR